MKLETRDPVLHDVIAEDAELEQVETGFTFVEGPIWHPTEHWLMFSDIATSIQYRWSEKAGLSVFRRPSNQSNGNAFDRQGRIVSCEHDTSHLVRHEHDGKMVRILASHYEGKELNSPNDVVIDAQGRIWFTDPDFGRIQEPLGLLRDKELDYQGVYRFDPDGTLSCVARDFQQPNGLCLSVDEKQLFVSDSWDPCIKVFDIGPDGSLTGGEIWVRVEGDVVGAEGKKWVPDGLKSTMDGYLLSSGPGGIHVFAPDGTSLGVLLMPEKSANFCLAGPDRDWLYVTACTSLYRVKMNVSGPAAF